MADKNFARNGSAGLDFLADDDPLSELARLVGDEPRPARPAATPLAEPAGRQPNAVLALEDELMRAFEQYDAPQRGRPAPDPLFDMPQGDGFDALSELMAERAEAPAVRAESPAQAPAGRREPVFDTPRNAEDEAFLVQSLVDAHVDVAPEPVALEATDFGLDLEHELELSIGEGAGTSAPEAPEVSVAEASWFDAPPAEELEPSAPAAEPVEVAVAEVAPEPVPEPAPVVEVVASTAREAVEDVDAGRDVNAGQGDDLLAEVERFPVPEARSPLSGPAAIFGRATPVAARREPAMEPVAAPEAAPVIEPVAAPVVEPVAAPVFEPLVEPVAEAAAIEPEIDFEDFELDLSDIELDLDADDLLADAFAEPEQAAEPEEIVERVPAVAVPVSTYTEPQPVAPVAADAGDGVLPFDPSMIADTDEGVAAVSELDVPHIPAAETQEPATGPAEFDFDLDAEMAQIFEAPESEPAEELASTARPAVRIAEVDDFERALEEDFRRSLDGPERLAIPVDPGEPAALSGDGYEGASAPGRRRLLLAASVAGLLLVGGGGVYAWMAHGDGIASSGEPRVILADKEPVKFVPEEKGGKTVPNQDKAVYDRVAGNTDAAPQQNQLVTTMEEPVDVVQRTLTPETLPFDGPADEDGPVLAAEEEDGRLLPGVDEPAAETAAAAAAGEGQKALVSPRKVKTMIVKSDGTLVTREEPAGEPEIAATGADAATEAGAETAAAVDTPERLPAEGEAGSPLAEVAGLEVEDTAPVRVVRTTPVGELAGKAPIPAARPVDQPVTVVGTVTENGNVTATVPTTTTPAAAEAAETQVAAATPGGYVIQIASLPSEAEAQKSYNALAARFSGVIGGKGVDIRKADIPNKGTFYRVRIPAGSRDAANTLCNRYKSAGGSCLVTR